jgi:hypothetical protein
MMVPQLQCPIFQNIALLLPIAILMDTLIDIKKTVSINFDGMNMLVVFAVAMDIIEARLCLERYKKNVLDIFLKRLIRDNTETDL